MKNLFLLFCILGINSLIFPQNSTINTDWEGNWWRGNGNMGSWFPSSEDLATFSIDDYSWGEIRSINQISYGTSINIEAQIINSSGGVNDDAAFFAIGDGWANYGGNNYGIVFRNGIVNFFEDNGNQNMTFKDTIGAYVIGEMITFSLTLNNDGTLSAQGDNFSGTFTPTTVVQNAKWIIATKDSRQNQGFYLKSIDGVQITAIEDEIVESSIKDYSLTQNYPNPFNPSTLISFSIPSENQVVLKIFNILGKEVAALVNEERPAGSYTVEFNASNLSSGIYFYRLQAGSYIETKKMQLLK